MTEERDTVPMVHTAIRTQWFLAIMDVKGTQHAGHLFSDFHIRSGFLSPLFQRNMIPMLASLACNQHANWGRTEGLDFSKPTLIRILKDFNLPSSHMTKGRGEESLIGNGEIWTCLEVVLWG